MKIKLLIFLVFLGITLESCKEEKIPNLNHIKVIYCTPSNLTECLPLEIHNTPNGWEAKYVGSKSKTKIQLKPRFSLNEHKDSIITFEEYLEGKLNGSYYLSRGTELFPQFREVYYKNVHNNDTIAFYACIIGEADIFIENKDVRNAFSAIKHHKDDDPLGCGSERRDLNLIYLLHSNPQTYNYEFHTDEEFETVTSSDGKIRLYKYYCWTGGNGIGSSFINLTAQYKTKDRIVTLDDFSPILLSRMKDFDGANYPNCVRLKIIQATLNGKIHYLIETLFSDPIPMPFEEGNYESEKTEDLVLFAFIIENGKLLPSNILAGKSMIELVNSGSGETDGFRYNDRTKILSIPILDQKGHRFTGNYHNISLN